MSSNKNTMVPSAREAMNKFKMEAASEVGVDLKQGYNGELTSKEAGSVGGQMVKKMIPTRHSSYVRQSRTAYGHQRTVTYGVGVVL